MNHLQIAFNKYDTENPHVFNLFEKFSFELINAGRKHYSASGVIQRIRWDTAVQTTSDDGLKIANAHAAFYARKFMDKYPQYKGFYRTVETGNH